jgi:hypothetical protein
MNGRFYPNDHFKNEKCKAQKKCLTRPEWSVIISPVGQSEKTGDADQGQLPKRSKGTDCKSVARASEVRILHCPPFLSLLAPAHVAQW